MVPKRAAVLQVLRESEGHLQADEIFRRVKHYYPKIVLATVYNNLHALVEAGHITHIKTADGADYYDKTVTPHEHAVCTACRKLFDVELSELSAWLRHQTKLKIASYDLILHALCPECEQGK